jgi:hypothetical protein
MRLKIVFLILLTFGVHSAKACKCQSSESVQKEFEQTAVIVSGKVLNKSYVSYESTLTTEQLDLIKKEHKYSPQKLNELKYESIIKIELVVNYIYKGTGIEDRITIYTSKFGASCGYLGFEIGQNFITYLSPESYLNIFYKTSSKLNITDSKRVFWTNQCRRTTVFEKMEDKELRKLMNR